MEVAFGGIVAFALIIAFLWGLGTLRELQQGQVEVLGRLERIERALQTQSQPTTPGER
jgi:regulator of protease activity HflC (stomatin/prohibitin superfamily)